MLKSEIEFGVTNKKVNSGKRTVIYLGYATYIRASVQ